MQWPLMAMLTKTVVSKQNNVIVRRECRHRYIREYGREHIHKYMREYGRYYRHGYRHEYKQEYRHEYRSNYI